MAPKAITAKTIFPIKELEAFLGKWWDQEMQSALKRVDDKSKTVFCIQPEMSSQEAVKILLELAGILGYEPTKKVIRRGGYQNRDQFILDMTTKIGAEFSQVHGFGPASAVATSTQVKNHAQL
ncbi:MAG TPA: hypothetical protein VGQ12_20455 [Candidatus Angelobacter sp.]|jgi:hypothetical protein|nr:hypothetical protein [Candidatus Angelobacter sp.]